MSDRATWAVRIPHSAALAAGSLRLRDGIEVCSSDGALWLCGAELSDEMERELRKLPTDGMYAVAEDGTLRPAGSRLPRGRLPQGRWTALSDWLVPQPQHAAPPAQVLARVSIRLVRDGSEQPASLLVTGVRDWSQYACGAPAVRLAKLSVAVAADCRALVRGNPLPSLPGDRYIELGGIAIRCGWSVVPRLDPDVLRDVLGAAEGDLLLLAPDASYEVIPASCFAPANRAGARRSLAELPQ